MAGKNKKKKARGGFPDADPKPKMEKPKMVTPPGKRPMRWDLVVIFLTIAIGGSYLALYMRPKNSAPVYTFEVTETFPHDEEAFTQGLYLDGDTLWESTGQYGKSTVRETNLKTGEVINKTDLPENVFGEGLTMWTDKEGNESFIQLTWKKGLAYFYDQDLKKLKELEYDTQGWGLTHDGQHLIVSDGTSTIRFYDPATFKQIDETVRRPIRVRNKGRGIGQINELEYVNGKIFANQWQTDLIYEIDPDSGTVESVIDLSGLWPNKDRKSSECVLNGIAFNPKTKRLLVTGKHCPFVWEIQLELKE